MTARLTYCGNVHAAEDLDSWLASIGQYSAPIGRGEPLGLGAWWNAAIAARLANDADARARAITWMFAALSTVEPPIVDREIVTYAERDKSWRDERMAMVEDRIRVRLGELSARLGRADWLDGAFSAADLLMVTVLRILRHTDIISADPVLGPYVARGEARPAFQRALAAQLAPFRENAPEMEPA